MVLRQLNMPVELSKVAGTPWLLDSSTNINDLAILIYPAQELLDHWVTRDKKFLHVVLRPFASCAHLTFSPKTNT